MDFTILIIGNEINYENSEYYMSSVNSANKFKGLNHSMYNGKTQIILVLENSDYKYAFNIDLTVKTDKRYWNEKFILAFDKIMYDNLLFLDYDDYWFEYDKLKELYKYDNEDFSMIKHSVTDGKRTIKDKDFNLSSFCVKTSFLSINIEYFKNIKYGIDNFIYYLFYYGFSYDNIIFIDQALSFYRVSKKSSSNTVSKFEYIKQAEIMKKIFKNNKYIINNINSKLFKWHIFLEYSLYDYYFPVSKYFRSLFKCEEYNKGYRYILFFILFQPLVYLRSKFNFENVNDNYHKYLDEEFENE